MLSRTSLLDTQIHRFQGVRIVSGALHLLITSPTCHDDERIRSHLLCLRGAKSFPSQSAAKTISDRRRGGHTLYYGIGEVADIVAVTGQTTSITSRLKHPLHPSFSCGPWSSPGANNPYTTHRYTPV
ncbi:hypothetical protein PM082_014568 [Marasmius tenuissimus]|nr:hypothetical protein PM082_014568 [Marasmius tenuissimus]